MPRSNSGVPTYRHHKASGQAAVVIAGQWFYLGPFNSKASKIEYDRLIGEWLAAGRPSAPAQTIGGGITVVELIDRYWTYAQGHYVKNGRPTGELNWVRDSMRPLKAVYGPTAAVEFGPLALKAVRQKIIESGVCRRVVNNRIERIRRMFKWAVAEELVPPAVYQALKAVEGLRSGKTEAPERSPVAPVEDSIVEATLAELPPIVADMVRFQRLTGCRPGEVCIVRPLDIDRTGDVWAYRPESHKTEHHGKERIIFIGPKGQAVLAPYLLRAPEEFCFSPVESEQDRNEVRRENRQSPMTPSQARRCPKRKPQRAKRSRYDVDSYRRAIHRGADKADAKAVLASGKPQPAGDVRTIPRWGPLRLRHSAATEIRRRFGLEAAQVVLGHSEADVTQIYAERDLQKAADVMRQVG